MHTDDRANASGKDWRGRSNHLGGTDSRWGPARNLSRPWLWDRGTR